MYICVREFSYGFWNCSDSVIVFLFFVLLQAVKKNPIMIMYRLHLTAELKLQSLKKDGCSPSFVIKIIKMRLRMIPRIVWKRSCIKLYIIPNNNFVSSKSVNYDNHKDISVFHTLGGEGWVESLQRLRMIPRIVWKRSCIKLYIIPNNNFVSSKSVNYDNHISNHTRLRFNDNWECFLFWNQNFCLQIIK